MGLKDIVDEDIPPGNRYRRYPSHPLDDQLEEWAEESTEKFPGGVEWDFIEVSPEMTKHQGFAYYKGENGYIRISEQLIENQPEWYIRMVLLHELTHLWFYQNGYKEFSDNSGIFEWVLGRVGADIDDIGPKSKEFGVIFAFLDQ